jgi:hypothetical protein
MYTYSRSKCIREVDKHSVDLDLEDNKIPSLKKILRKTYLSLQIYDKMSQ